MEQLGDFAAIQDSPGASLASAISSQKPEGCGKYHIKGTQETFLHSKAPHKGLLGRPVGLFQFLPFQ